MLVVAQSSCFSSVMAKWKLCFVLLLPLTVCFDSEVTLVKTIKSEPDVTPICNNSTLSNITLIVCKIRTERNSSNECRLLYQYGEDFVHECDSRFTLITKNQTVFLHLTSLTPEDSGFYTCECSDPEGTYTLHLNITVLDVVSEHEPRNSTTQMKIPLFLIVVTTVITITTAIFGFICRSLHNRKQPEPLRSPPNTEPEDIEPYSTFIRREGGLYSMVRVNVSHADPPITSTKEPQSVFYT